MNVRFPSARFALRVLILFVGLAASAAKADTAYAPKLSFRLSNGMLKNSGPNGGSGTSILAPNVVFDYYFSSKFALGIGYYADFDFSQSLATRRGVDVSARYYWKGRGTQVTRTLPDLTLKERDQVAYYAGAEFSQRDYYLGGNEAQITDFKVTGSYSTINLLLGTDRRFSQNFDFNAEISYSLFAFAGSDNRYVIRSTALQIGFSYLFR